MPFTITMPKLSPTMEEGTIAKWHVKEGDLVESGQVLIEVATDKATLEYQALDGGYVRKILVEENAVAEVNQPIAILTVDQNESLEGYDPTGGKKEEAREEEKEPLKEEKPTFKEKTATSSMQEPAFYPEPPLESYAFPKSSEPLSYIPASPLAKKIALDEGLDLSSVKGSGPNGKVMKKDLAYAQKNSLASFQTKAQPEALPGEYSEIALTPMRKAIGKRLQESKSFIPHFYVHQDIDASSLLSIRAQLKAMDVKLTVNDFIIRAVALALKEHPGVNSGYNSLDQKIVHFKTVDVSIAVTLPDGLITPIIRYADAKNIGQISQEVKMLSKKAKEKKLDPTEYKGGSFTISNLGMFGVSDFVAIINPPQSAILSISGIEEKPVIKEEKIVKGHVMRITLSADHRVIDGTDGAKFIKTVQKLLENPAILLL